MRDSEGFPKQDLHSHNLPVTKSVMDQSEAPDRELTAGRGKILFCFTLPFIGSPSSLGGINCVERVGTDIYVHPGGTLGW